MELRNDTYSVTSHLAREQRAIGALKLPGFVKAGLVWMNRRTAARAAKAEAALKGRPTRS